MQWVKSLGALISMSVIIGVGPVGAPAFADTIQFDGIQSDRLVVQDCPPSAGPECS